VEKVGGSGTKGSMMRASPGQGSKRRISLLLRIAVRRLQQLKLTQRMTKTTKKGGCIGKGSNRGGEEPD
jgi:hypothetical protein